jgi:hypothetical protein
MAGTCGYGEELSRLLVHSKANGVLVSKTGNVRITEALSYNHSCSGKAVTITYSECLSVALVSSMQCASTVLCFRLWPV